MVQADIIVSEISTFQCVSPCYKSNGQRLVCVHPIQDALGWLVEYFGAPRTSLMLPLCSPNYP